MERVVRSKKCHNCKKPIKSAYSRCGPCRKRNAQDNAALRLECLAEGICTTCRKWPAEVDRTVCQSCVERYTRLVNVAKERAERLGLCHYCRRRLKAGGRASCVRCHKRRTKSNAARRSRDRGFRRSAERILYVLRDHDRLSLIQLAEESGLTTRTVLRHMRKLEPTGAVVVRQDESVVVRKVYSLGRIP